MKNSDQPLRGPRTPATAVPSPPKHSEFPRADAISVTRSSTSRPAGLFHHPATAYRISLAGLLLATGCFSTDRVLSGPPVGYETDVLSCSDGRDNDEDGLFDCQDPDCIGRNFCGEVVPDTPPSGFENDIRTCTDLIDNDLDGQFDCGDRGCQAILELCCITEFSDVLCSDGIDNDGNGFADCDDFACRNNPFVQACRVELVCDNGEDDDDDGDFDCDDRDCEFDDACRVDIDLGPENNTSRCTDGVDNDENGFVDCREFGCCNSDGVCINDVVQEFCDNIPEENTTETCTNGEDDDGNGFSDCREFSCCRDGVCINAEVQDFCDNLPSEDSTETCTNGIDDDDNGFFDCNEFSCCRDAVCINSDVQTYCDEVEEDTFEDCTDGIDNDGDGFLDCNDFSCSGSSDERLRIRCEANYESCRNGIDDDDDGFTDCSDRSCEDVREILTFDGESILVSPCNESVYTPEDIMDDPDAETMLRRLARQRCSDGIDGDGDGFVDCDDWDCQWNPLLNPQATDRTTDERGHCQGYAYNSTTRVWSPLPDPEFNVGTLLCQ